jgi:hypothetical protein
LKTTKLKIDGFVKSQNFDFCSWYHFEFTGPEIFIGLFVLFAATTKFNSKSFIAAIHLQNYQLTLNETHTSFLYFLS